jgi:hypothetical protein
MTPTSSSALCGGFGFVWGSRFKLHGVGISRIGLWRPRLCGIREPINTLMDEVNNKFNKSDRVWGPG